MHGLNVLLVILSIAANAKSVGDRENGFHRKRFDLGLETCMENFDVHVDKIIRVQDSRAMGAKYINEAEVPTRDDCMKMCCETPLCDVFVYEQKVQGSCFLFHCGSPEDFKCKFTQHRNYTSAVLTFNNRFGELNNQMKLTKHEEELNMLRKLEAPQSLTSTSLPLSTKVPVVAAQSEKPNYNLKSQCSRYQFECKESGDCIAIYNACDGIPQCSDGSDEAPELDCPTISGSTHPKTFHDELKSLKETIKNSSQMEKTMELSGSTEATKQARPPAPKSEVQASPGIQTSPFSGYFPFGYPQQNEEQAAAAAAAEGNHAKVELPLSSSNQPKFSGREGEIVQYPLNSPQWQGYPLQRPEENGYVFNRKSSGLIPENSDSQISNPYNGNEISRSEYMKYGTGPAGKSYYGASGPVYYPGPNGWIPRVPQNPPRAVEDGLQRPVLPMYGNGILGSVPSDYYYEDSQFRGRYGQVPQDLRRIYNAEAYHTNQKEPSSKDTEKSKSTVEETKGENISKTTITNKKVESAKTTSIATPESTEVTVKASIKEDKPQQGIPAVADATFRVADHLKMSESDLRNVDGVNEKPSGAILSLTLGVCITAIMITLVGCRLRVVRKRMRRNGKSPFAHDADFLVNGMYL